MAVSKTKQARNLGYMFEYSLTKCFNPTEINPSDWQSRRLGGASTGLPDLVITNNNEGMVITVECKAQKSMNRSIPNDELIRCLTTLNVFSFYKKRMVVLAFKFMRHLDPTNHLLRIPTIMHFFRLVQIKGLSNIKNVSCNYYGKLTWSVINSNKETWIKYDKCNTVEELKKLLLSHTIEESKL